MGARIWGLTCLFASEYRGSRRPASAPYPPCVRNSRAGSSLCLIVRSGAGLCVTWVLNDKTFFVVATARDTQ
jgi:hypothetical protein